MLLSPYFNLLTGSSYVGKHWWCFVSFLFLELHLRLIFQWCFISISRSLNMNLLRTRWMMMEQENLWCSRPKGNGNLLVFPSRTMICHKSWLEFSAQQYVPSWTPRTSSIDRAYLINALYMDNTYADRFDGDKFIHVRLCAILHWTNCWQLINS